MEKYNNVWKNNKLFKYKSQNMYVIVGQFIEFIEIQAVLKITIYYHNSTLM